MGKKGKVGVGRAVLKDKSKGGRLGKNKESWLHTSELNDSEDWNRICTKSVTEQSALDEFLTTAELAGTEFVAEKLNITIYNADNSGGLPSKQEQQRIQEIQDQHKQFLQIPRRPKWDESTTPEQLDQLEKDNFLAWRRGLAELQAKDDLILTPFERNLEFWRQLWRVIERSDVVVQIVDARNPLLFHCEDLESYVKEIDHSKVNVLLINKADFLTQKQRETWATYFKSVDVKAIFWSAVYETERLKQMNDLKETENPPSQSEAEEPEAILTDSHVTEFLNLKIESEGEVTNNHPSLFNSEESKSDVVLSNSDLKEPSSVATMDYLSSKSDVGTNALCDESGIMEHSDARTDYDPSDCETSQISQNSSTKKDTMSMDGTNCNPSKFMDSNSEEVNQIITSDKEKESLNIGSDTESSVEQGDCVTGEKSFQMSNDSIISDKPLDYDRGAVDERIAVKNVEFYTSGHLLTGEELLVYCQWLHHQAIGHIEDGKDEKERKTVIGLVGYPNVGKSSTINAILQAKKVPVSSTPGRTKHFQTLLVDKTICLCDCPGLVFPSFVSTKAEMVVSGILPIDQLRDHVPPVALVCQRIPRDVLETLYGINLPKPEEYEDPDRPPFTEEFLDAYSYSRGFITSQARSDSPRSARYILKDYVNGKLLYCHPPPTHDPKDFQMSFTNDVKTIKRRPPTNSKHENKTTVSKMDSDFFKQEDVKSHTSATTGTEQYQRLMTSQVGPNMVIVGKPWKKHGNRNKKEKLRRLKPNNY
ncbi:large subunit GTPase 1 homolog [Dendronephthya gigantea]|uniref:large subunit GTPase 1 homolog n=1 Tax=Dendronephthya gigantea TaxID=151771 RepID=UPI00106C0F0A|nr:large subunit GTPase 1 homolog [Dendronephthya gigantea]